MRLIRACWVAALGIIVWASAAVGAAGLLRVHADNRRYFTDDSGKAIYLAGHQWFNDVQPTRGTFRSRWIGIAIWTSCRKGR